MTPEFSRAFQLDAIGSAARAVAIEATGTERLELAKRFDLVAVDALAATAVLVARAGGIDAAGTMTAEVIQSCVVTHEPVPARLEVPFAVRFVDPEILNSNSADEVELGDADLDVVAHDGSTIDLGEAVAQTLGLSLDPFPRSASAPPEGESVWRAGPDAGPFAALKGLIRE